MKKQNNSHILTPITGKRNLYWTKPFSIIFVLAHKKQILCLMWSKIFGNLWYKEKNSGLPRLLLWLCFWACSLFLEEEQRWLHLFILYFKHERQGGKIAGAACHYHRACGDVADIQITKYWQSGSNLWRHIFDVSRCRKLFCSHVAPSWWRTGLDK